MLSPTILQWPSRSYLEHSLIDQCTLFSCERRGSDSRLSEHSLRGCRIPQREARDASAVSCNHHVVPITEALHRDIDDLLEMVPIWFPNDTAYTNQAFMFNCAWHCLRNGPTISIGLAPRLEKSHDRCRCVAECAIPQKCPLGGSISGTIVRGRLTTDRPKCSAHIGMGRSDLADITHILIDRPRPSNANYHSAIRMGDI
jgi:hypothetical protein